MQAPDGARSFVFDAAAWLLEVRRIQVVGTTGPLRSPDGESLLVVLGGTHDLYAGGGSWLRRGVRAGPLEDGRPVAVFLPPNTPFRADGGDGALLLVAVRQPEPPPAHDRREELGRKPLLPLAGSGKAYDPISGEWKLQEAFLSSPEAILPRRLERLATASGARADRVIGTDYKALGLCVDEVLLAAGQDVELAPPHAAAEVAVHVETTGRARVGELEVAHADGPTVVHAAGPQPPRVTALDGRAYALFVYAGPKRSG